MKIPVEISYPPPTWYNTELNLTGWPAANVYVPELPNPAVKATWSPVKEKMQ